MNLSLWQLLDDSQTVSKANQVACEFEPIAAARQESEFQWQVREHVSLMLQQLLGRNQSFNDR